MTEFVTRFAPSPTGPLHLGHAFSAITAYRAAQRRNGRFLLRIEDIDRTRCKPEFERAIYDDLSWLGLQWEEPVRRQSDHFDDYVAALGILKEKNLVYRCFKTRKEILEEIARAPHLSLDGPEGPQYLGRPLAATEERSLLADGARYAWRLSISGAQNYLGAEFNRLSFKLLNGETVNATPEIFGDVVLARKDSGTSYHLASVYDDALQGITHIVRGNDLYHAAHLHVLLQMLLDLPTPVYAHHRLITDGDGKRLAKRDKSATLKAIRESGATPEEIFKRLNLQNTAGSYR